MKSSFFSKVILVLCLFVAKQSVAEVYQVACATLNLSGQRVGARVSVNVDLSSRGGLSIDQQNFIIYQAMSQCRALTQANLNAIPCNVVPAGTYFAGDIGYLQFPAFSMAAFYSDYFLSSSTYKLSTGLVQKAACPAVDPCARLPWYKQDACHGL